jgi:hypothetical protein
MKQAIYSGGGVAALSAFRAVWLVDFEFQAPAGERPRPVCMVARELHTGRMIRLWREDLLALRQPPFETGPDSLFVAYYASAELGCFLALGWAMPACILDLFVEYRCATNGIPTLYGDGLIGALVQHGLAHLDAGEKEAMRRLIMEGTAWSEAEQAAILDYCQSDVDALAALLPRMTPGLDLPRALLRGRYMAAVAGMEWTGIPIDAVVHTRLQDAWGGLKGRLIADVDRDYGVYEGVSFKAGRFGSWLQRAGIPWPRLLSGALALDDETFRQQARLYPHLEPLRQLRATLGQLRLNELAVGSDRRNRCLLSPFRSGTGRNQPSNTRFVFGPSRWIRGLIRPPEGYGLAYIDFSSQEIAIAAALAGDELMMQGYTNGDPYLAFAKAARLVPPDATKASHKAERDRCKAVVLGVNYGMGPDALAASLGITRAEANELMQLHRGTYRRFWSWSDEVVTSAMLTGEMQTVFGWRRQVPAGANARALMNFPMQANGAEMMRMAAIAATEAGIEVCAPIHDAFLIAAPLERLEEDVTRMRGFMSAAGQAVTGGFDVRTDATVVRWPNRYTDEGGQDLWVRVMRLTGGQEGLKAA